MQFPDKLSGLSGSRFLSNPDQIEDLKVMAITACLTNTGRTDAATGSLVHRKQLERYLASVLTSHLNSFGVSVTLFRSGAG